MQTQTQTPVYARLRRQFLSGLFMAAIMVPITADMEVVAVQAVPTQLSSNVELLSPATNTQALDELADQLADDFKLELKDALNERLSKEMKSSANVVKKSALERQLVVGRL